MCPNVPSDDPDSVEQRQKRRLADTGPLCIPYSEELPPEDTSGNVRAGVGDARQCPLCGFASEDRNDVYVHLMAAHRKSRVSDALLTHTEGGDGSRTSTQLE